MTEREAIAVAVHHLQRELAHRRGQQAATEELEHAIDVLLLLSVRLGREEADRPPHRRR